MDKPLIDALPRVWLYSRCWSSFMWCKFFVVLTGIENDWDKRTKAIHIIKYLRNFAVADRSVCNVYKT